MLGESTTALAGCCSSTTAGQMASCLRKSLSIAFFGQMTAGVYSIPCVCAQVYTGQRHQSEGAPSCLVRSFGLFSLGGARHQLGRSHPAHNTSIPSTKHMVCTIREEIEIVLHSINMNREDGFHLSKSWKLIFSLKNHRKPPSQDSFEIGSLLGPGKQPLFGIHQPWVFLCFSHFLSTYLALLIPCCNLTPIYLTSLLPSFFSLSQVLPHVPISESCKSNPFQSPE